VITPPEPAALLRELVRIPSPSGEEAQAADFCADLLSAGGLAVERLGNTLLARLTRGPGPTLLLNTHLDTVPIGKGWTVEPLDVEWEGERLFGRGSNDAKVSVAAMISAALNLARDALDRSSFSPSPASVRAKAKLASLAPPVVRRSLVRTRRFFTRYLSLFSGSRNSGSQS
jgi:acetylornithine deacetylase/succinyl-diaminopimelate desuccinylase-like protein